MPPLIGQIVLDRYLVEEELGQGTMGTVYRGSHTTSGKPVAIKVLHPHLVHDRTMRERFHREAKLAARLAHPNVVGVLGHGATDAHEVIVMELARGRSLRAAMAAPLPRSRILALLRPILAGLEHAHACGLIHRDLKPENIIVEPPGDTGAEVPRIADFGIAVLHDPDDTVAGGKLTASGQVLGTPIYMAPEQARAEPFDHRIDLFALGVIVYEMLCGKQPFEGTAMEIAVANITLDAPPISTRAPHVQADRLLEAYARRLMQRDVRERVASAREALALLDVLEDGGEDAECALRVPNVAKAYAVVELPWPLPKR